MKIVFLINSLEGGGAERIVCTLANYISEIEGRQVYVFVLENKPIAYPLSSRVQISRLHTGKLSKGFGKILFLPLISLELAIRLRHLKAQTVMSLLVRANLALAIAKSWLPNQNTLIGEMCYTEKVYSESRGQFVMTSLIRFFYPKADNIIAISNGVKESMVNIGIPRENISVIYNPINIRDITESASLIERPSEKIPFKVIMAGRLTDQKDYPTMLRALKDLLARGYSVRLTILGEGPEKKKLVELSEDLRVSDFVEWGGWKSNLYQIFPKHHLFVLCSKYEGFANVIVEAMAASLPVVSTDCLSGPSEILENGRYGILTPIGNSTKLADAVASMIEDDNKYERYKLLSFTRAKYFDVSNISTEYIKLFDRK
jgi:glycosyltransferase involved in cell wall biosynthesis